MSENYGDHTVTEARKMNKSVPRKRVWLLSWNVDNWKWDGYAEMCQQTKMGVPVIEGWSCLNTHPKNGDEVFLIKLGNLPKGIVGHGTVIQESYKDENYDPNKKKTIRYIDVKFDRLIDYEKEKYLPQRELQRKCGAQYWSPQGSGIEIKPEVVPVLHELWRSVTTDEHEMVKFDHNLILSGPPGTGKTYNSIIYAVAICEGKPLEKVKKEPYSEILRRYNLLKDAGRIAFITFHQSYGYEEFIEGIKPKLDENSGTLGYIIEDGVFKNFCNRAKSVKVQTLTGAQIKPQPQIWGMILGGTGMTDLKRQCFKNGEIRLGRVEVKEEDANGGFTGKAGMFGHSKHIMYDFQNTMEIGDVVVIEKNSKSIDAIGVITGDCVYDKSQPQYPRSRSVEWLVKDIDKNIVPFLSNGRKQLPRFSVFSFDYIGINSIAQIVNEYRDDQVVKVKQETKPYVFIIDEINRGNISKIFGELITLIEDKKRAGAEEAMDAILPYSRESFSVPQNVYILSTMNTADRSIALMDTALRRRFEFEEMMPESGVLKELGIETIVIDGVELNIARMLDTINERIEYLFDREHTIGHAFFVKLADNPSIDTLSGIFKKKVVPLLQEYFFEDYEKIQLVLGDNKKDDEYKFILDTPVKVKDIFNGNPDVDLPEKRYQIQESAFDKIQSYKLIGKDL